MLVLRYIILSLVFSFCQVAFSQEKEKKALALNPLPNAYGQLIDPLKNVESAMVVVFTNHNCLYAQLYIDRLNKLYENYAEQGIPFVAIETKIKSLENRSSSLEKYLEKEVIKFPYLIDIDNTTAALFRAESSPHVYLLRKKNDRLEILFEGSIDNNSRNASRVTRNYLKDAIDQMLANEEITYKRSKPIGCDIRIN